MNALNYLKRKFNQFLGLFPTKLPVGMSEFQTFVDSLQSTYTLPTEDRDSIEFAVATMVMRLGPQTAFKSKFYFYISINAGCAKQIAGTAFHDIKVRQQALQNKQAEVSATTQAETYNANALSSH